jgi:hypothetical protein
VQGETSNTNEEEADDWRAALRQRFGAQGNAGRDGEGDGAAGGTSATDRPSASSEPPEEIGEE